MLINPTSRTLTDRIPAATRAAASETQARTSEFESQLSSALAESLQKLGVGGGGEVNILIRNPTSSTRQIVVTYSLDGVTSPAAPATPATPAVPTSPAAGTGPASAGRNPFLLSGAYIAPTAVKQESATPWAPYLGPKDTRDELPEGGGKLTASGAPLIVENSKPAPNQSSYAGPAAKNPYFTSPSNPLREGYVLGFDKWFEYPKIHGGLNGPQEANRKMYATEEGAAEALRIARMFSPQAEIVKTVWRSGPYGIDTPMHEIELGGGRRLNAGGVLSSYYSQGYGVVPSADETIRHAIQLA